MRPTVSVFGAIAFAALASSCGTGSVATPRATDGLSSIRELPTIANSAGAPISAIPPGDTNGPGSVVVVTGTILLDAVPEVPVSLHRVEPCDPGSGEIPVGAAAVSTRRGVTDGRGEAFFVDLPVGCYQATATPPTGRTLREQIPPAAYLTESAPGAVIQIRFLE